jgi:hypothetical protein
MNTRSKTTKRKPAKKLVKSVNAMITELAQPANISKIIKESVMTGKAGTKRTPSSTALRIMAKYYPKPKGKTSDIAIFLAHYTQHQVDDEKQRISILETGAIKKVLQSQLHFSLKKVDSVANVMSKFNKALGPGFRDTSKLYLFKTKEAWAESKKIQKKALLKNTTDQIRLPTVKFENIMMKLALEIKSAIHRQISNVDLKTLTTNAATGLRSKAIILIEACTGVRHIGTLGQITWEDTKKRYDDGQPILLQKGRRKDKTGKTVFDSKYRVEKPLLIVSYLDLENAVRIVKAHSADYLSEQGPFEKKDIDEAYSKMSSTWTTSTNKKIKTLFKGVESKDRKKQMSSHRLRAAYATYAIWLYPVEDQGFTLTRNKWLGQGENSSAITHYENIQLLHEGKVVTGGVAFNREIKELKDVDAKQQVQIDEIIEENETEQEPEPEPEPVDHVLVEGKRVDKNKRQKGKTLANARRSLAQYVDATGKKPTNAYMRKTLKYGGSVLLQLNL